MLYYSDSNDLTKNKNILNNQNYIINTRIKSNVLFSKQNDNKSTFLKIFIGKIIYLFRNLNNDFKELFYLHLIIFLFFIPLILILGEVGFLYSIIMFYLLSFKLVDYYYDFKHSKFIVLGFRRVLDDSYEDKLIGFKNFGNLTVRNNLINYFASICYSTLVLFIFYSIYIIYEIYA